MEPLDEKGNGGGVDGNGGAGTIGKANVLIPLLIWTWKSDNDPGLGQHVANGDGKIPDLGISVGIISGLMTVKFLSLNVVDVEAKVKTWKMYN